MAVIVNYNHLPNIHRALGVGIAQAVNQSAARVKETAQRLVPSVQHPGPYATNALRTAIHIVTEDRSEYAEATSSARIVREHAPEPLDVPLSQFILPETHITPRNGWSQALVVAPLSYAYLVEYGGFTGHAGRAAGPFMAPAGEAEQATFVNRCTRVCKRLELFSGSRTAVQIHDDRQAQFEFDFARSPDIIAEKKNVRAANREELAEARAVYGYKRGKLEMGEYWDAVRDQMQHMRDQRGSGGYV